jgi:hypothetical protein
VEIVLHPVARISGTCQANASKSEMVSFTLEVFATSNEFLVRYSVVIDKCT